MTSSRALPALLVLAVGGCFTLDRTIGIEPGSVAGAAVDEDGARLSDVVVAVEGTGQARRSTDGAFTVAGLSAGTMTLRLTVDGDGDGVVDRGARLPFVLERGPEDRIGFVLFGDVTLPETATIRGRVVDGAGVGVAGARVVAAIFAGNVVSEAVAAVDSGAGGVFVLEGVLAGEVTVVASGPGTASVGVVTRVVGGDDVDVGAVEVLAGGADANITVTTLPAIDADVAFVRRPDDVRTEVPADIAVVPPGVFDVEVEAEGASNGSGVLKDLAVPRDRPVLQVVVVLEGVAPRGSSGGGSDRPPDGTVDAGVDPGRPPDEEQPQCNTAVTVDNGIATPGVRAFADCELLSSLKISGTPSPEILDALRALQIVDGDVVIEGTSLSSLEFLTNLDTVRRLEIRDNAALTTIDLGVTFVDQGILIANNGTRSLSLQALQQTSSIELIDLPLTSMTAGPAGVDTLILRGAVGAQNQIYAALGTTRRFELLGLIEPVLPTSNGFDQLVLENLTGMSFATMTAPQLRELDVHNSTIDIDDLTAWQPFTIQSVTFLDNRGADDAAINGWIGQFDAPPQNGSTVSGNTFGP